MRNPVKNEETAFRFLLGLIGYFGLIVLGAKLDRWLGLAVFLILTAAAGWWFSRPAPRSADEENVFLLPDPPASVPADATASETQALAPNEPPDLPS